MYRGVDVRGVSFHHGALVATAFWFDGCFVLTTPNEIIAHTTPSTLSVGWESIVYIKRRKKAAAYKTRPSTAAFVHVLVLLAAGLALCYGEINNLT